MINNREVIVLTGGAGFIGSCFLWKLNQEGIDNIIVVDNLTGGCKWKNLLNKKFYDYIQKDDFLGILESGKITRIKTIVHLGACSSTILNDADYFLKNNYEYSKRLALWADAHSAKFIYASSAATYGDGSRGYDDDENNLCNLRPLNIYGYSKHLFDLWMFKTGLLKKAAGFKFFNVFGPNEYHKNEMASVICRAFEEIKAGKPLRLFKSYRPDYKDGEQKRDFVYVLDAVEIMYYFFTKPHKSGIFNLGSGHVHTWNELAEAMFLALEKKPNIAYIDMPQGLIPRYQYFTRAKMEKTRAAGCTHEFMALKDAVKHYILYLDTRANL